MSNDFDALLIEIAGHSAWEVCNVQPERDPYFSYLVRRAGHPRSPRWEPTEAQRERWRELRAGRPPIEAQGELTARYSLIPLEVVGFAWRYYRNLRYLVAIGRDGQEHGPLYYHPRPILTNTDRRLKVDAWVEAELKAGRGIKPDQDYVRDACSTAVHFDVSRQMLRDAIQRANQRRGIERKQGRPRKTK